MCGQQGCGNYTRAVEYNKKEIENHTLILATWKVEKSLTGMTLVDQQISMLYLAKYNINPAARTDQQARIALQKGHRLTTTSFGVDGDL